MKMSKPMPVMKLPDFESFDELERWLVNECVVDTPSEARAVIALYRMTLARELSR